MRVTTRRARSARSRVENRVPPAKIDTAMRLAGRSGREAPIFDPAQLLLFPALPPTVRIQGAIRLTESNVARNVPPGRPGVFFLKGRRRGGRDHRAGGPGRRRPAPAPSPVRPAEASQHPLRVGPGRGRRTKRIGWSATSGTPTAARGPASPATRILPPRSPSRSSAAPIATSRIPSLETLTNFVGGRWVPSGTTQFLDVHNPATGEVIARTPLSTGADVDAAVRRGIEGFPRVARHAADGPGAVDVPVPRASRAALRGDRARP